MLFLFLQTKDYRREPFDSHLKRFICGLSTPSEINSNLDVLVVARQYTAALENEIPALGVEVGAPLAIESFRVYFTEQSPPDDFVRGAYAFSGDRIFQVSFSLLSSA